MKFLLSKKAFFVSVAIVLLIWILNSCFTVGCTEQRTGALHWAICPSMTLTMNVFYDIYQVLLVAATAYLIVAAALYSWAG